MSEHHEQRLIDAPAEQVWELVSDPTNFPSWWPRVVEIRGERFEEGDEYVQVTRLPKRDEVTQFVIDRKDDMHEVRMHCKLSGTYAHWRLTPAQGGTFVDATFGMEPERITDHAWDRMFGRRFFRAWLAESVEALKRAAATPAAH